MSWNPGLYLRFEGERTQPCIDLASRIGADTVREAIDLGCGPGNSTAVLAARWPSAGILGVDSSAEMLAKARAEHGGRFRFEQGDIAEWNPPGQVDLVFSNAAMHWVHGQQRQLVRQLEWVRGGGWWAMQIPYHLESAAHRMIQATASAGPWAEKIGNPAEAFEILNPDQYYEILAPHASRVDLWVTRYLHVLPDTDAAVEWMKGTGLRPVLAKLEPTEQEEFLSALKEEAARRFPVQSDGKVLFAFPRLFAIARKR